MFRPLQGHHQGRTQKYIEIQQNSVKDMSVQLNAILSIQTAKNVQDKSVNKYPSFYVSESKITRTMGTCFAVGYTAG